MKDTLWNLLTIIVVIIALVVGIVFLQIFVNPYSFINPLPPPELPEILVLPSPTATLKQLPTIAPQVIEQQPTATRRPTETERPTWTPLPTSTTFILPTSTIAPTKTPTVTPTSSAFNCKVVSVEPSRVLPPGGDFDGRWTLKNTGTDTWSDTVDFVYIGGTRFQTSANAVDLPKSVSPDDTVEVVVDMVAPTTQGTYETIWALRQGDMYFCEARLTITVRSE